MTDLKTFKEVYGIENGDAETQRVAVSYFCHHDTSPRFETIAMHETYIGIWAVTAEPVQGGPIGPIYEIDVNRNATPGFLEDGVVRADRLRTEFRETLEDAMKLVFEIASDIVRHENV